jgi:hypothetical protein
VADLERLASARVPEKDEPVGPLSRLWTEDRCGEGAGVLIEIAAFAFESFQWLALIFFVGLNGGYIALNLATFFTLPP